MNKNQKRKLKSLLNILKYSRILNMGLLTINQKNTILFKCFKELSNKIFNTKIYQIINSKFNKLRISNNYKTLSNSNLDKMISKVIKMKITIALCRQMINDE